MHMKRFSLPLLALALCLFGCTPKENPTPTPTPDPKPDPPTEQVVPAKVTLNETSVSLTGEGSKVVTFTSATDWKAAVASGGSSWLTVSPTSGSAGTTSVTVKAKANPTYDDRETTFTITGTGKDGSTSTGTVHVTQAATLGMVVEQKAFEVPAAGGTVTVKVKANTDYTYTIDASGQGWITETTTRALTEYVHTFKVDANDQYDSRQGTITFKNTKTGETDQVTVTQDALLGMIVEQKAFEVAETGGSITVTVKANTEYDYVISESSKEWITESTTRGLTEYTHTFKIAPNDQYDERIGVITFRDTKTGATEEVQVRQGISPEFEAERAALMAIFNALDGPNWESHEYWGTEAPVTWWPKVFCDENGHVVSLDLNDPGIKGSLPPEIGNLPYLTDLNLGGPYVDCHFTGSLPEEIGKESVESGMAVYRALRKTGPGSDPVLDRESGEVEVHPALRTQFYRPVAGIHREPDQPGTPGYQILLAGQYGSGFFREPGEPQIPPAVRERQPAWTDSRIPFQHSGLVGLVAAGPLRQSVHPAGRPGFQSSGSQGLPADGQ